MFTGTLVFHSLGNDTTTGSTPPFSEYGFLALPLGAECNPGVVGGKVCGTPTIRKGAPLVGSGSAVVAGSSPADFTVPATELRRITRGVLPPYVGTSYTMTSASLENDVGSFVESGGPGSFSFVPTRGLGSTGVEVVAGARRFGGAMRLLGALHTLRMGKSYVLTIPQWPISVVGGSYASKLTVVGVSYNASKTPMLGTVVGYATGFPWTTGTVRVSARGDDPPFFPTYLTRRGYDDRTPMGAGTIQLVTPMLTHWTTGRHEGHVAVLRLEFVPQPSRLMLFSVGVACLIALRTASRTG